MGFQPEAGREVCAQRQFCLQGFMLWISLWEKGPTGRGCFVPLVRLDVPKANVPVSVILRVTLLPPSFRPTSLRAQEIFPHEDFGKAEVTEIQRP